MFNFFKKNKKEYPDYWNTYAETFKNPISQDVDATSFIVLDTETTGFDYVSDRILCIGALEIRQQTIEIHKAFEVYIQQDVYGKESAKIHGILKDGVIPKISELEALQLFLRYLGNKTIVAHHAFFDINMINKALARQGLPPLKNNYLDTSNLYKKTLLKSKFITKKEQYSLDELADKFSISKKDRHTALGDAYITAIIFLKIITKLKEKKEVTLSILFQ
ncbi:MAG: 3'-5' exonuclease [Cellulophaga sp.]|nr:3'-5' exonuclease [Cellulophaga sp.]